MIAPIVLACDESAGTAEGGETSKNGRLSGGRVLVGDADADATSEAVGSGDVHGELESGRGTRGAGGSEGMRATEGATAASSTCDAPHAATARTDVTTKTRWRAERMSIC